MSDSDRTRVALVVVQVGPSALILVYVQNGMNPRTDLTWGSLLMMSLPCP